MHNRSLPPAYSNLKNGYTSIAPDPAGHPDIAYSACPDHVLKFAGWQE